MKAKTHTQSLLDELAEKLSQKQKSSLPEKMGKKAGGQKTELIGLVSWGEDLAV